LVPLIHKSWGRQPKERPHASPLHCPAKDSRRRRRARSCKIVDISEGGALLQVDDDPSNIPDRFMLLLSARADSFRRRVVRWRSAREIGLHSGVLDRLVVPIGAGSEYPSKEDRPSRGRWFSALRRGYHLRGAGMASRQPQLGPPIEVPYGHTVSLRCQETSGFHTRKKNGTSATSSSIPGVCPKNS
jgi:hypothetical protein